MKGVECRVLGLGLRGARQVVDKTLSLSNVFSGNT